MSTKHTQRAYTKSIRKEHTQRAYKAYLRAQGHILWTRGTHVRPIDRQALGSQLESAGPQWRLFPGGSTAKDAPETIGALLQSTGGKVRQDVARCRQDVASHRVDYLQTVDEFWDDHMTLLIPIVKT